jgi:hypothetical protein
MLGDAHRCVAIWPFLHKLRAAVTIAFVGQISDWKHTRHATCNTPATATARDLSFNRNLNAQQQSQRRFAQAPPPSTLRAKRDGTLISKPCPWPTARRSTRVSRCAARSSSARRFRSTTHSQRHRVSVARAANRVSGAVWCARACTMWLVHDARRMWVCLEALLSHPSLQILLMAQRDSHISSWCTCTDHGPHLLCALQVACVACSRTGLGS